MKTSLCFENITELQTALVNKLVYSFGVSPENASKIDWLNAILHTVRDHFSPNFVKNQSQGKKVYYLSIEFLLGRTLSNALINVNAYEFINKALEKFNLNLDDLINEEPDPGLGNGGLGRLAACFLDSLATLKIPATGYGIQYKYGMFSQEIKAGEQVELPDRWQETPIFWPYEYNKKYTIKFGGNTVFNGSKSIWQEEIQVTALAKDHAITGYNNDFVNSLRLWYVLDSGSNFNFNEFNKGNYVNSIAEKNNLENISLVLYPDDSTYQGRLLRLHQEYFLCSASIQDILAQYEATGANISDIQNQIVIHLNDTHPTLAIVEFMRILIDEKSVSFEDAWNKTKQIFCYTNHTLMQEALEKWQVEIIAKVLPRHLEIMFDINALFLNEVRNKFPNDEDLIRRVSIFDDNNGDKLVRMAWLAVIGSKKINGVAKIHSDLMKTSIFSDFAKIYPERFTNVTNGITPRRWLKIANPELSKVLDECIGSDWVYDLNKIAEFKKFANDTNIQNHLAKIKKQNKQKLADYIYKTQGIELDVNAIFDVQIKRIHEYKRQQMNVLHIVSLYNRILANPQGDWTPRVFFFAGKAASAYYAAKKIIRLINDVAEIINNDERINNLLKVVFIPNYSVSLAQLIIPAADLSEQISLAGTEASGTSNMKFALNGALTIGTMDGANIEIFDKVGAENMFIFGNSVTEVQEIRAKGYNPNDFYQADADLHKAIDQITQGKFSPNEPQRYQRMFLENDYYQACADFRAYLEAQNKVAKAYNNQTAWLKSTIINIAGMGYFSSDRSIEDYAKEIWQVEKS